ncbi:MAG: hypothetical protein IK059_01025 [Firmicutes bacterium]|nr:hypothetical protein [Bacillota bacterium]
MENTKKAKKNPFLIIAAIVIVVALAVIAVEVILPRIPASAATELSKVKISLDDENYKITKDDTVVIPAGRPRIPQIICDDPSVEVYQAFFPDDKQVATATLRRDGEEREITFIKDESLGLEFQYDDRIQWAGDIPNAVYESTNPDVAKVSLSGQIIITGVSDEPVTLTATNGVETEEFTITRTVKAPISIYILTGQSNAAYYFAEPEKSDNTKKGTAYVYDITDGVYSVQSMNNEDGSQARGNIDASIAKSLYDNLGEKVLIVNTGISGNPIETFEPDDGVSYAFTKETWDNLQYILKTDWWKDRFEEHVRSYIWIQGESDDWALPERYMYSYMKFHECMRSPMYGCDYGFISQIVPRFFRPNDAQERLAQAYDDIWMATRITNTFSPETGELRSDNLHYTQMGDNIAGEDIGHTIAMVYQGFGYMLPEGEEDILIEE